METDFVLESSLNSQKELFDYLELLLDEIAHLTGYKLIGGKNSILKRVLSFALWIKSVDTYSYKPKIFKIFGDWFLYETESNLGFRLDNKLYQKIRPKRRKKVGI